MSDDAQPAATDITALLSLAHGGDAAARERLYAALYAELTRLARHQLAGAGTISLDAPALLHEAYMRLCGRPDASFPNRKAFFAYAAMAMRSVLIDHVRQRRADKRGGGERALTLTTGVQDEIFEEHQLDGLNNAISELEKVDKRCHRVVEMRYFAGLSEQEVADALEVSLPTVKRDWRKARAFLYDYLAA